MLTQEWLREQLDYDRETGVFKWRTWSPGRRRARAGSDAAQGYRVIIVAGKRYMEHRLAWLYCHGDIPAGMEIDHRNGDTRDNRLCNLRLASRGQNARNRKLHTNNSTGFRGVYLTPNDRFQAMARIDGKTKCLGTFDTAEEAHRVYLAAISGDKFRRENITCGS